MGRKPNQLILEYFDRGPKLEDASNRYQYHCKACHEHFPKGRIDTLKAHVTQKCPLLSSEDRQRALQQMEENLQRPPGYFNARDSANDLSGKGILRVLPVSSGQKFTGLEALAEASRRVEHPPLDVDRDVENDGAIDPSLRDIHPYDKSIDLATRLRNELGMSKARPFLRQ